MHLIFVTIFLEQSHILDIFTNSKSDKAKHWQDEEKNFEKLSWKVPIFSGQSILGDEYFRNKLECGLLPFQTDIQKYFIDCSSHWLTH